MNTIFSKEDFDRFIQADFIQEKVLFAITKKDGPWEGEALPINGNAHDDSELGVTWKHYHIDWRYVDPRDRERHIRKVGGNLTEKTEYYFLVVPEAQIVEMKWYQAVRYGPFESTERFAPWITILEKEFGGKVCKGKRCPHKGADLSDCVPSKDGTITCPYHGLIIDQETMKVIPHFLNLETLRLSAWQERAIQQPRLLGEDEVKDFKG